MKVFVHVRLLFSWLLIFAKVADHRPIYLREGQSKLYSPSAYFWGRVVSELFQHLLIPSIFFVLVYWVCGLNDTLKEKAGLFWLSIILCHQCAVGYALTFSIIWTYDMALLMAPAILLPMVLFSGFLMNVNDISKAWSPLIYISFPKYAFSIFTLVNNFDISLLQIEWIYWCSGK